MEPLEVSSKKLQSFVSRQYTVSEMPRFEGLPTPRLTIITPSFNQAGFLERTILSVLNQGYPNLEYFIIDGGSDDGSIEIIKKYEKYLAWWVSEKDKGQVDALNKGLRQATGEWVGFQNSDDVYFPETFLNFSKAQKGLPQSVEILYGDLYLTDTRDQVTELLKTIPFSLHSQLWEGMQMHNQSLFFRSSLLKKHGYFDESYRFAFDYDFITRYASAEGVKAKKVNGLSGALRVHESAKSSTIAEVGRAEHVQIRDRYAAQLNRRVPTKIGYLCIRLRKALYLAATLDFGYLKHRFRLNRKQ